VVAAVEGEVGDKERVDAEHDERRPNVHDKGRDDRENRQHARYARGYDAARRAVGALKVRLTPPQHDVRERHQDVGDRRAEDCAVEQGRAGAGEGHGEGEADDRGDH
jgi:hypothetical protein